MYIETGLDREMYRKLKNMSREKLTDVLGGFYAKGKSDALSSIKNVHIDLDKIRAEISDIKGVGEVRLRLIMEIIERALIKSEP